MDEEIPQIMCSKSQCQYGFIYNVCLSPQCANKNRLICQSNECWKDHIEHQDQIKNIRYVLQWMPQFKGSCEEMETNYKSLVSAKVKEFQVTMEAFINIKRSPLFGALKDKPLLPQFWTFADLNGYVSNLASIKTGEQFLRDPEYEKKIEQISKLDITKIILQELEFQKPAYFPIEPVPNIPDSYIQEILQIPNHQALKFSKKSAYSLLDVTNNGTTLTLPYGINKLAVLPINLFTLQESVIKLILKYTGDNSLWGDGSCKFGLYFGNLQKYDFEQKNDFKNNFIMISDSGIFSYEKETWESDDFKVKQQESLLSFIFDKQQSWFSIFNSTQFHVTFKVKVNRPEMYFCTVLSGNTKVEIQ